MNHNDIQRLNYELAKLGQEDITQRELTELEQRCVSTLKRLAALDAHRLAAVLFGVPTESDKERARLLIEAAKEAPA